MNIKQYLIGYVIALVVMCSLARAQSDEFLLYKVDRTMTTADKGFIFMYGSSSSSAFPGVNVTAAMKSDLTRYQDGMIHIYMRIDDMPVPQSFSSAFVIWQDNHDREQGLNNGCSGIIGSPCTKGARVSSMTVAAKAKGPIQWHRARWRQSFRFWVGGEELHSSRPAWSEYKDQFFPMDLTYLVVLVPPGNTFSGWDNYDPRHKRTPYLGKKAVLPGRIQAEDFDEGINGVAYYDADGANLGKQYREDDGVDIFAVNDGGYKVASTGGGEWLDFTVDAAAGTYDLRVHAYSVRTDSRVRLVLDGKVLGTVNILPRGTGNGFQTAIMPGVQVPAVSGKKLRVEFLGSTCHIDWIEIMPEGQTAINDRVPVNTRVLPRTGWYTLKGTPARNRADLKTGLYLRYDAAGNSLVRQMIVK